jgi:hypothetical protein
MGSGMHLTKAPFRIDKGVQQGAVESSWFFAIACNKVPQNLNNKLTPIGGGVMAMINDNYIIGPKEAIFEACKGFSAGLTDVGLEFQPEKSACYIAEEFCTAEWDSLQGDIPNGLITGAHGKGLTKRILPGIILYKLYTYFFRVFRMYSVLLSTDFMYSRIPGDQGGPIFFRLKDFFCGRFMYKLVYYNLYYMSNFTHN